MINNVKKYRKNNPKKETTHQRRAKILKEKPWWVPK